MNISLPPSTYLAQAAVAAFISALVILMLRRPAERWGLVDHPGGRKRHGAPVPLTGGLAVVAGFALALTSSFPALADYPALFAGLALLAVTGLLDDLGEMSATSKMLAQVLAAVFMTSWGSLYLTGLGDLFGTGPLFLHDWAIPVTVFAAIAVINSVNMFDGLDGLAGSLVLVILLFFSGFAWSIGDANASKVLVVLAGAM
ncbi:MAG TPA: MraY family glycosyltransferase, partial [Burkholderiaceae bacterium]|nr:MraY family glycosyltransferase [Burkholderiaceae bacterium]